MYVVVASANIFRRELTSFVLGEAGYLVAEANSLHALLDQIGRREPSAIVVDAQIDGEPAAVRAAVRARSAAPILWLADPEQARPLLGDGRSAALGWPYLPDELRACVGLLVREPHLGQLGCTRAVGGAEEGAG
jgi:DNA-binding response OmpR family regulator